MKKNIQEYNNEYLVNEIISYKGSNKNNYYKNSLIAILKVLQYVKNEINLNINIVEEMSTFLQWLLLHIQEFVGKVLTYKTGKNYDRITSRKMILSSEVFDLARRMPRLLMYKNEITYIYQSIFLIRQAIELKIKESLCIESIINKKYLRPVKVSPDIFIGLLNNHAVKLRDTQGVSRCINVNFIKKVHSWTNTFIHSGVGYWFWEVEFIRMTLQDFVYNEIIIDKEYLKFIPEKILQCIKEEERKNANVIMSNLYYKLINNN